MRVRDIVSQLRELLNNVNVDVRFTNQYLHSCLITATKLILKREAETRKIFRSIEAFQEIECLDLEPASSNFCGGFLVPCYNLQKSVKPLPDAYLSSVGSILLVYSVDKSVQFLQSTPSQFSSIQKRQFKGNQKYFWIIDNYLYIPNSHITNVSVLGLFIDVSEVDKLNGTKSCKFMDSDSGIPDWLQEDVLRTALQNIAGVTKKIPEDPSPNMIANA